MAGRYSGGSINGVRHGKGVIYSGVNCELHGEWNNGTLIHGQGSFEYINDDGVLVRDVGIFRNNYIQSGQRLILNGNQTGGIWEGIFVNGSLNGLCKYSHKTGDRNEIELVNGIFHGVEKVYNNFGTLVYTTRWQNGTEIGPREKSTGWKIWEGIQGWASK